MKCTHCGTDLPSRECPECNESVPLEGRFCHHCGAEMPQQESTQFEGTDFSERTLCSDGACIGIINEKGICNECGKPYAGETE
ncbi:MAG: zinc ribbon domain-containing protein [Deltaproteobacteria bacterium]|nr:zinc ribbon domain-containing protein [Deltaproteobacteria bacterium]MBW2171214.1 zinc ribbon domain-containing protein [Deltaproteobacteria bacterium]MBW2259619.1 zinc ribbon domain-containing protein [Deltaproteobacteria bacterium]